MFWGRWRRCAGVAGSQLFVMTVLQGVVRIECTLVLHFSFSIGIFLLFGGLMHVCFFSTFVIMAEAASIESNIYLGSCVNENIK